MQTTLTDKNVQNKRMNGDKHEAKSACKKYGMAFLFKTNLFFKVKFKLSIFHFINV